jgi:hypothetical protein
MIARGALSSDEPRVRVSPSIVRRSGGGRPRLDVIGSRDRTHTRQEAQMAGVRRRREETPKPTFVFKGTVKKLNRTKMKHVSAGGRTAVVRVDEVVEANPALARLAGQDITVQLSGRAKVPVGDRLMFHTIPLMFGESVSVQAVEQEPLAATDAAIAAGSGDPPARKALHDLQDRFAEADVVVSGRVKAVTLPPDEVGRRGGVATSAAQSGTAGRPASEHDPKWRDAVVEVDAVHKGRHAPRTITVRFPESTDVRWYEAPKFSPGQQGFFMLQKAPSTTGPRGKRAAPGARGSAAAPASGPVYTALHPADFQPYSEAGAVTMKMLTDSKKARPHA